MQSIIKTFKETKTWRNENKKKRKQEEMKIWKKRKHEEIKKPKGSSPKNKTGVL